MKQFEYKVIYIWEDSGSKIENKLNDYGKKGWEFVQIKGNNIYIFKREIKKKEESL